MKELRESVVEKQEKHVAIQEAMGVVEAKMELLDELIEQINVGGTKTKEEKRPMSPTMSLRDLLSALPDVLRNYAERLVKIKTELNNALF